MGSSYSFESIYSIRGVLLAPFVSVGLMLFALGFYVLLFGMVVYFFYTRRQAQVNRNLHLSWMVALFVVSVSLSLLEASITIIEATLAFQAASTGNFDSLLDWETLGNIPHMIFTVFIGVTYIIANCIADTILLYRCFIIWGSIKRVLTGMLLVLLCTTHVVGFVGYVEYFMSQGQQRWDLYLKAGDIIMAYNIANAANTLLLTFLIGIVVARAVGRKS
ncbi:hypothetical protein VNI00_014440 [Paramarasmius palmivorus]|uniref:Uncharacterized protein n=1 Tax=Paramarasmius palmivorus TaxID=297713 RepID=A0AAW0BTA0_9AGAR